jgi:pilus assembly protein Flp/PilA
MRFMSNIVGNAKGATAIEYGLILALVCLALMGALIALADGTSSMWGGISTQIVEASGG